MTDYVLMPTEPTRSQKSRAIAFGLTEEQAVGVYKAFVGARPLVCQELTPTARQGALADFNRNHRKVQGMKWDYVSVNILPETAETIRAALLQQPPTDQAQMVADAIEWLNEIRCWINRCKDTEWGDDDQCIVDFITKALQQPTVPRLEGLREALKDYECASDAILGKNIDVLAKAARWVADNQPGEE